jgi:hypothetical protein
VSRRKPQRGCCGVCGCPVEAPSLREVRDAPDWCGQPVWLSGHQYDGDRLLSVRCPQHGGRGWPVDAAAVGDATVLM